MTSMAISASKGLINNTNKPLKPYIIGDQIAVGGLNYT
jgi:hypothetical protein